MSSKVRRRENKATKPETKEAKQENVIGNLRLNAETNKRKARQALDVLVIIAMFMCARQAVRYGESGAPLPLTLLTIAQTLLLPFSLSPGWTRVAFFNDTASNKHQLITAVQLVLFLAIFLGYRTSSDIPTPAIIDILRWALPELVTGAVEIQRGSERDSEKNLANLDNLKYNLKGA